MHVEPGHPDAGHPLLARAAQALIELGGEVVIHTGDDNLVRSRRAGDPGRGAFIVEASGLPNLLHELLHVLQFGRLADDHGIDYGQIPFDLELAAHRRLLWEELTCCVVSCAYLEPEHEAPWFAEQVGIQGVFYGHDDDPEAFLAAVERAVAAHPDELAAVLDRAYTLCFTHLNVRPRARLEFAALWARLRAG